MKKLLLSLMFCFVVLLALTAQDAEEGKKLATFWGVPWRTSVNDVKELLKNKNCKLLEEGNTKDGCYGLVCDGTFGGEMAEIYFFFYKDRLFSGKIYYPHKQGEAVNSYMEIKRLLEKKYGNATYVEEAKLSEYGEDSISSELLIKNEGLKFASKWEFSDDNYIIVNITDKLGTRIIYTNNALRTKAIKEIEELKLNDF